MGIRSFIYGDKTDTALGVQQDELRNARQGVLYYLANTEINRSANLSLGLVGNFVADHTIVDDIKKFSMMGVEKVFGQEGVEAVSRVHFLPPVVMDIYNKIKAMASELFQTISTQAAKLFKRNPNGKMAQGTPFVCEWLTELGPWFCFEFFEKNIAIFFEGIVQESIIPIAQGAVEIYSGVRKSVLNLKDWIIQSYKGYGVEVLGGHPSTIAKALVRHSASNAASGLVDTAIGSGKLAVGIITGGTVGIIVNIVTGIFQRFVKMVDFWLKFTWTRKTFTEAKDIWNSGPSVRSHVNNQKQFSDWFQWQCTGNPIIAALVMGSGYVGNPLRFLQLINSSSIISQAEYDKGVKYINRLQKQACRQVAEIADTYGFEFSSSDGVIQAQLSRLQSGKPNFIIA